MTEHKLLQPGGVHSQHAWVCSVSMLGCAQSACLGVHLCHYSVAHDDSGEELHTAAVTVYVLQRSMTWVLLLQPDKHNHMQALELGTKIQQMVCWLLFSQ